MKNKRKKYGIIICLGMVVIIGLLCKKPIAKFLIQSKSYYLSTQKADMDHLASLDIPVLQIDTQDQIEPSYEILSKPKDFWADGVIGKKYLKTKIYMIEHKDTVYKSNTTLKEYGAKIRIRGNFSTSNDKKSYKIKLSEKYDLIQGDSIYANKDWVLLACNSNQILSNYIGFDICKNIGKEYVPRYKYINIVVNGNYRGVYVLAEQIEKGKNKIDISSDGVLLECDAYWWVEKYQHKKYFQTKNICMQQGYTFKYPKHVTSDVFAQGKKLIQDLEASIKNNNYGLFLDVDSWCTWLIGHDILGTFDCGGSNIYISRENMSDTTRIKMPCLWDFDTMFWQPDTCFARIRYIPHNFYFNDLIQHDDFKNRCNTLWFERGIPAVEKTIKSLKAIKQSSFGLSLEKSRKLDADRWDCSIHIFSTPIPKQTINDEINNTIKHLESRKKFISQKIISQQ